MEDKKTSQDQNPQPESNSSKTYTEEEHNRIISGIKQRYETRIEKDYVPVDKYNAILQENIEYKVKPQIKQEFLKQGGREEAFDDYLKLNNDLLTSKDLTKGIQDSKAKHSYMFNASRQFINPMSNFQKLGQEQYAPIKNDENNTVGQDAYGNIKYNKRK